MFHILFSVNYWVTKYVFRKRKYPLFSTIAITTAYQFFTLLFIYDLIFYQVYNTIVRYKLTTTLLLSR